MSEERTGPEPGETDDLDELLGEEGDEPGEDEDLDLGETGEKGGEEEPPEPPQPQTRGQRRREREQAELRELRESNRRLQDVLLRGPQQAPQAPVYPDPTRQAELDRQEIERVAQMPFEEQGRYWGRKAEDKAQQQILRQGLETRDMLDRIQFQQVMRDRRLPARYATEVDNLLAQARREGMNPTREWLLNAV